MTALVVEPRFYDEDLLSTWSKRDLSMLTNSGASEYLRRVLSEKARGRRKGRASSRFFGEAFVAAHEPHQRGYYSSFKWLTNRKFTDRNASFPKDGSRTDKEEFREALLECFDGGQLRALQARAEILYRATGERPVPPDLWLIDKSGHHRFIEVKLPSDW